MDFNKFIKRFGFKAGLLIGFALAVTSMFIVDAALAGTEPPCTIALMIQTVPDSAKVGLRVLLKDGGSVIMEGTTADDGGIIFELGGIATCKTYTAVILSCEDNPSCTRSVAFNPDGYTHWDVTSWVPPVTTTLPPTTTTTLPPTTTTTLPCPECPECLSTDYTLWAAGVITAVAAILGGMITKYAPYKGKSKIESYLKKDGTIGYRAYAYEQYKRKDGTTGVHWVKKKEW